MLAFQSLEDTTHDLMCSVLHVSGLFHLMYEYNEVGVYNQLDGVTLLNSIKEFFGYLVKPCKDQAYLMGAIEQQHQNTNTGRVK
jgi:hypothetical protein